MKTLRKSLCYLLAAALICGIAPATIFAESSAPTTYNGCDVINGYYYARGSIATGTGNRYYIPFYYSDGMFLGDAADPTVYDPHLATMSCNLSIAINRTRREESTPYRHTVARQLLADIGCEDSTIFVNEDELGPSLADSIGFIMANKKLKYSDGKESGKILVPIAIRGYGYDLEWINNFIVGTEGEAEGFSTATSKVYKDIKAYIENYNLTEEIKAGNVLFWVVGYSRGGAIANLLAKRLVDDYGTGSVCAYTLESPMPGVLSDNSAKYDCIHNLVNYGDLVTKLVPSNMGFTRYGQDFELVPYDNTSDYNSRLAETKEQLWAIAPTSELDIDTLDEFEIASATIDLFDIGLSDLLSFLNGVKLDDIFKPVDMTYSGTKSQLKGEWFELFIEAVQNWVILDENKTKVSRESYTTDPATFASASGYIGLEKALGNVMTILLPMDDDQKETFVDGAKDFVSDKLLGNALDLINNLENWNNPSKLKDTKKESFLLDIWNDFVDTGAFDAFDADQVATFEKSWPTFANLLFSLVSADAQKSSRTDYANYNYTKQTREVGFIITHTETYYGATDGTELTEKLMLVSTLILNIKHLLSDQDALVNLAWARTYDDWYSAYDATILDEDFTISEEPTAPKAVYFDAVNKEMVDLSSDIANPTDFMLENTIYLDADEINGEAIFYTVDDLASTKDDEDLTEQLYQGIGLNLKGVCEESVYAINVFSRYKLQSSEIATYYISTVKPIEFAAGSLFISGEKLHYNISYDLETDETAQVIVTAYNEDGQYCGIVCMDAINKDQTSNTVTLLDGDYDYMLFLVDDSFKPLTDSWDSRSLNE